MLKMKLDNDMQILKRNRQKMSENFKSWQLPAKAKSPLRKNSNKLNRWMNKIFNVMDKSNWGRLINI